MNITRHNTVMNVLAQRAERWERRSHPTSGNNINNLDETGTTETELLQNPYEEGEVFETRREELSSTAQVNEEVLSIHGIVPGDKPEGVCRLLYENINGIQTKLTGNFKLDKARSLINKLEADIVAYNEVRVNWKHKQNVNGLAKMFQGGELDLRAIVANNAHKNPDSVTQEGGTALLTYGSLVSNMDRGEIERDDLGLGRWVVTTYKGSNNLVTRVLCGYNGCKNRNMAAGTVYAQQYRYLTTVQKDLTCPRTKFREDLIRLLSLWRAQGDRLIVCLDANENIYKKSIGKSLTDIDGLGMKEVVGDFTNRPLGATHFRGSTPIDGVWATPDIVVVNACVMPCGYGIGDHRLFIVDFLMSSIIWSVPTRVVRSAARRLNTRLPGVADKYTSCLTKNLQKHRLLEKLEDLGKVIVSDKEAELRLNSIDKQSARLMIHAEKKCRKLKSGNIPFTPQTAALIRRTQVYSSLIRYQEGHKMNRGNLARAARRCGIEQPFALSLLQLRAKVKVCREESKIAKITGWNDRRKHLLDRARESKEEGNEEASQQILDIIKREQERSFWRRINYAMGKTKGRSVSSVQVESAHGDISEFTSQASVQDAIWTEIHNKRFYLAEEAPICKGNLRGDFGYLSILPTAQAILEGTYTYPQDFDDDTKALCIECAKIRCTVARNEVDNSITASDWTRGWKKMKEDVSSSVSGLHFGHYKASVADSLTRQFHALKASLVLKHGIVLDRWSSGLSVMLEKLFGCTLVSKLRSILLMEADFNFTNKTIYGVRMMDVVRKYKLMPDEIFSEKRRMAEDGTLAKTLFYDISRQARRPAGLASVDAESCYDRVAHAIASLVFQAFGVSENSVVAMLKTIQEMKFFLRTAYGDSADFAQSSVEVKSQGLCQGNGAAPAGWAVISITLLNTHKERGHSAVFRCPITRTEGKLAAIIYVDDTDILHMNLDRCETSDDTLTALQSAVLSWGGLLRASGGALKPVKCFYYLIDYEWNEDGTWRYVNFADNPTADLRVPISGGNLAQIEMLGVDDTRKTLGYLTCPSGNPEASISRMQEQAQEWVDKARSGGLLRQHVWFMMDRQLWPRVGYSICNNIAPLNTLEACLQKQYYQILPLGGVVRSSPRDLRQLSLGFYGIGCPHPGVECTVAQINKLVSHYGCTSVVGKQLQISTEFLVIELGLSDQPFKVNYEHYGGLVTHCWLKSLWEKVWSYKIIIELHNIHCAPPRQGDKWLMQAFIDVGYKDDNLLRLNRVRLYQQTIFLSDILEADGRYVDRRYTQPRQGTWSKWSFPEESPADGDFQLWREAIAQVAPGGRVYTPLKAILSDGHKIWSWRYNEEEDTLSEETADGDIIWYKKCNQSGLHRNRPNHWIMCSQAEIETTTRGREKLISTDWLDVLQDWGCVWLWENLVVEGDDDWILESIRDGNCVAVTDGSYMEDVNPNLCSAAFIFECKQGRGRIHGSFCEFSSVACSYRGELLGLMAIHLILLSISTATKDLQGHINIFSDCKTALWTIENLPPTMIPCRFRHSDILKTILVNCQTPGILRNYIHVPAHQDDTEEFESLSRQSQLNCIMDHRAKKAILEWTHENKQSTYGFPLEPISVRVGLDKVTSQAGPLTRFWVYKTMARLFFHTKKILFEREFNSVDWEMISHTLQGAPRLFQLWACKQVMNIAGTFSFRAKYEEARSPLCPSCMEAEETCGHILHCTERGRVRALHKTIDLLETWLEDQNTDPDLLYCLVTYARGRGERSMEEMTIGLPCIYRKMGALQDRVGWRRFMEGMIVQECRHIQHDYLIKLGLRDRSRTWAKGLIMKLLECTHGQWLYRNVVVHNNTQGALRTARKEELRTEILQQLEWGDQGLSEEDHYLLEINLGDLEKSSGAQQEYWVLAMKAARVANQLRVERRQDQGIG